MHFEHTGGKRGGHIGGHIGGKGGGNIPQLESWEKRTGENKESISVDRTGS